MSSKRHLRRKSCEGKARYDDLDSARSAARRRSYATGHLIVAYRCRFGRQHYHIGHAPAWVMQTLTKGN